MRLGRLCSFVAVCLASLGLMVTIPGCPKSKEPSKSEAKQVSKQKGAKSKQKAEGTKQKPARTRRIIDEE